MQIVKTNAEVPTKKMTDRGFTYDGTTDKVTLSPEKTIQNTRAGSVAVTNANFAAMRKMYGGGKHLYAVGAVTAQPDAINGRFFDDFKLEPKPPFVIPGSTPATP